MLWASRRCCCSIRDLPTAVIVGSDIAHAVPLTLVAGLGHWWLGSVNWPLLLSLLCGSLPGCLGSHIATRMPDMITKGDPGRQCSPWSVRGSCSDPPLLLRSLLLLNLWQHHPTGNHSCAPARAHIVRYAREMPPKLDCSSEFTLFVINATNGGRCQVVNYEH